MANLTMEDPLVRSSSNVLGASTGHSYSAASVVANPAIFQVKIQWKHILLDAVQMLGVRQTVYSREETMDGTFQVRVIISFPLHGNKTRAKDINVIGAKCPTLSEAESDASAAALQELQHGYLNIHILDVSRIRFKDMGKRCQEIIVNNSETYHLLKSLLSDWGDTMDIAERCYSPNRQKTLGNLCHSSYKAYGDLSPDVADHLAGLIEVYYAKLKNLAVQTETLKIHISKAREDAEYCFHEPYLHQGISYPGTLPHELKVRMRLVLKEMAISLGWECPIFNVFRSAAGLYVCETSLVTNQLGTGVASKTITISGSGFLCKEEAIESSCKAAILSLETERFIYLLDLNYSNRSQGNFCVTQATEVAGFASLIGSKVLAEWEAMVDEIGVCQAQWQKSAEEHPEEEQTTFLCKKKWSNTKTVAALHRSCVTQLLTAKNRLKNSIIWAKRN